MATAIEYGIITAGISIAIIAVVQATGTMKHPRVENAIEKMACAQPTTTGSRREIAWVEIEGKVGHYVRC